eukprot:14397483-Alexandrium_andersonii.AAC.1
MAIINQADQAKASQASATGAPAMHPPTPARDPILRGAADDKKEERARSRERSPPLRRSGAVEGVQG